MEQVLVSVVMPSYNHKQFVGKAIESVLKQTYTNFEFIIADDGSSDGSWEIISQYDDPRIKFVKFEKNTAFGALEYAYEMAKGDYIAAVASDDMWKEELLEKYIAFLENNKEYGCCFCYPEIIDDNDNVLIDTSEMFIVENRTKEEWFYKLYLSGNCICASSMCMRREIYKELGAFRFKYMMTQDYEYWLRMLQISNIYVYPEKLMNYRIHHNGENKNISAVNGETIVRVRVEKKYIMLDMMEHMDEEFFVKAFAQDLVLQPDMEGFCVECEKFGVLLKCSVTDPAINYYYKHYNDKKFRECLEKYYQVPRKEFWRLTGADHDHYYESMRNRSRIEELEKQVYLLKQELKQKEEQEKI